MYSILALCMSLIIMFQTLPFNAFADLQEDEVQNSAVLQEESETEEPSVLEAEWEDTGKLNEDGSPVTAEQGDTPEESGVTSWQEESPAAAAESYCVTLNLNGGQVNSLQSSGWTQSSSDTYKWLYSVTEETAGEGISLTLDKTLGGLLPDEPYRAGYTFEGWKIGDTIYDVNVSDTPVTVYSDTDVTAVWEIATYTVSFQNSTNSIWSVQVPYGATLWTDTSTPWMSESVQWKEDDTASIDISLNDIEYENVDVTRHSSVDLQQYYYTFTIGGVPYFTYGGPFPTKSGQNFASWKLMSGGNGFTVTGNAVFAAQFQTEKTYVFNVYFYYEDGTRAKQTAAITKTEADVMDGKLSFEVEIPEIQYYTAETKQTEGVSWNGSTVTVNVETVFGTDNTSATNYLVLTVLYSPADIQYTVVYYQQNVDSNQYTEVGRTENKSVKYGSKVFIQDRPSFSNISFDGFQISLSSQSAVSEGVVLRENSSSVTFNDDNVATISIYYDRASYFIYFQTGTTEVQVDPIKVRYGSEIRDLDAEFDKLTRAGYQTVNKDNISWYRLNESGELTEIEGDIFGRTMPAYDLYAVVTWIPATTSIRLVYWVESRNAASFQNAYTVTVEKVKTEAELTVNLDDSVTISGDGFIRNESIVSDQFKQLIDSHYGTKGDYTTFFSYSVDKTKTSPGNVANAQATQSGNVADSAITDNSFKVKVNGDGTTTINIYYTRNLYSLEFVLVRHNNNNNNFSLATKTPGSFQTCNWSGSGTLVKDFVFADFSEGVTAENTFGGEIYGDLNVKKIYRITDAAGRDERSPVGRYGTKRLKDSAGDDSATYTCSVYVITARFEADISSLWPTAENIAGTYNNTYKYKYISMGTDENSYYRNVFTFGNNQKNILNEYATMDLNVVAMGTSESYWTAEADDGDGKVAHQMVAYWAGDASEYHYYFLYEALDTTVSDSDNDIQNFDLTSAEKSTYTTGQYVSRNGKVYVYSESYDIQYSTFEKSGQNQPSKQGFESAGKEYYGAGDTKGGNIYFFYDRKTYTLDIQNENGRYSIPESLLTNQFDCLSEYGDEIRTLGQLGWEKINDDGTVSIRYGGYLPPLSQEEIINWLTSETGGGLEYPYRSAGESQYYFWRWYRNQMQTIPVDWEADNDIKTMDSDNTLYAGWFTPRYVTSYVLNGGSWTDSIDYTLTSMTVEGHEVYIYYPHTADDSEDPLYWYIQSKENDRLYVDTLYVCNIGDVAQKDDTGTHWELRETLTINELMDHSSRDFQGTRLVDHYYCYMGAGESYNHNYYVNINAAVNTVLKEPTDPVRTGYTFSGWFYFDSESTAGTKVYLKDVLTGTQSLASYKEGYVYLNHVGDAFLLHEDENGELFYYADQTGYRFSYSNDASVVVRDLQLYAAWEPKGDAKGYVYHLVEKNSLNDATSFTPKNQSEIILETENTISIGGTEYYILSTQELTSLYTGSTYSQTAWEYCTDNTTRKWLPVQASIDLMADDRTQTVTDISLNDVTGNTYRIEQTDGTYVYYAFFVYQATNEVVYNVYTIDLSVAVAEGVLNTYQDTFDRSFQVDTAAPYFLSMEKKSVEADSLETTLVVENAPSISGYSVYQDWSQTMQLQTDASANNIFFYYVREGDQISFSITYYLMVDGKYSSDNTVTISNIPAVTGEIISLDDMASAYDRLVTMAQTYSGYSDSANEAQKSLYERYKDMTITWNQSGISTVFQVNKDGTDTLDLSEIADFYVDYYVDSWSPTGNSLVVSNGAQVEAYLAAAQLIVQKVDSNQQPLAKAEFKLERLVESERGTISYGGRTYEVDNTFSAMTATSGTDGKAVFSNLSARIQEDGSGYLYRLTEIKSPKGYNCLEEPLYVTAPYTADDETHYSVTYTVVNTGIAYLPMAGVFGGIYTTMFFGIGLMAAAAGGGFILYRRRKNTHRRHEERK